MAEAKDPALKDHPVLAHFRESDPKTGDPLFYDPKGDYDEDTKEGWPGAKTVYAGVPGSEHVLFLQAGADGHQGPLIGGPVDEKKATASSTAKEA